MSHREHLAARRTGTLAHRLRRSLVVALSALALPSGAALSAATDGNPFQALNIQPEPPTPGAMTATYFGTTTVLFREGDQSLMVDGFFSRPGGILRLALGPIQPNLKRITKAMTSGQVPERLNAVLVSHTHHDHALDSAWVACNKHAELVGTQSMQSIQKAQLSPASPCLDRFRLVETNMAFGAFEVEAINTEHTPGLLLEGTIDTIAMPAHFTAFKMDGNYSFLVKSGATRVLVSTGMPMNRFRLKDANASVVFLAIGGLRAHQKERIEDYWNAVVVASKAAVVVPTHWDDFTTELDKHFTVMPPLFGDFKAVMCQLVKLAERDHVAIRLLPPFAVVDLSQLPRTLQTQLDVKQTCVDGLH